MTSCVCAFATKQIVMVHKLPNFEGLKFLIIRHKAGHQEEANHNKKPEVRGRVLKTEHHKRGLPIICSPDELALISTRLVMRHEHHKRGIPLSLRCFQKPTRRQNGAVQGSKAALGNQKNVSTKFSPFFLPYGSAWKRNINSNCAKKGILIYVY